MTRRDWENIRDLIEKEVYKIIRLAVLKDGKYEILISFNKANKEACIERFNYLKSKAENNLPPGTYQVQCRLSPTNQALQENYELIVKEKQVINITSNNGVHDKTKEQTTDMDINFEDHIQLIKENATLKAMNAVLETERDFFKAEFERVKAGGLADGSTPLVKSTAEVIGGVLSDTLPGLVNLGDKFMELLNKRLDNDRYKMESGVVKKVGTVKQKVMAKKEDTGKTFEQEIQETAQLLQDLESKDPDKFDEVLDLLEEQDPELYDAVCEVLGIEDEDGEEEEETEEEETE